MPPTVMTPWLTPCCALCVVLVGVVVAELLPPELLVPPPELFGAVELDLAPELAAAGAAWLLGAAPPLLSPCATGALPPPLLTGAGAAAVAPPLGVPVSETPAGVVYACPATAATAGCPIVA